jgi:hypothetical protein
VKGATALCLVIKAVLTGGAGFSVGKQGGEMTRFVHESDCDHVVCLFYCCPRAWQLSGDIPTYAGFTL